MLQILFFPQLLWKNSDLSVCHTKITIPNLSACDDPQTSSLGCQSREACARIRTDAQPQHGTRQRHWYSCRHKALGGGMLPATAQLWNPSFAACTSHVRQSVNVSWSRLAGYMQRVLSWSIGEAKTKWGRKRKEPNSGAGPWMETDFRCSLRSMV